MSLLISVLLFISINAIALSGFLSWVNNGYKELQYYRKCTDITNYDEKFEDLKFALNEADRIFNKVSIQIVGISTKDDFEKTHRLIKDACKLEVN